MTKRILDAVVLSDKRFDEDLCKDISHTFDDVSRLDINHILKRPESINASELHRDALYELDPMQSNKVAAWMIDMEPSIYFVGSA